jgi:hypothetical protein
MLTRYGDPTEAKLGVPCVLFRTAKKPLGIYDIAVTRCLFEDRSQYLMSARGTPLVRVLSSIGITSAVCIEEIRTRCGACGQVLVCHWTVKSCPTAAEAEWTCGSDLDSVVA